MVSTGTPRIIYELGGRMSESSNAPGGLAEKLTVKQIVTNSQQDLHQE